MRGAGDYEQRKKYNEPSIHWRNKSGLLPHIRKKSGL